MLTDAEIIHSHTDHSVIREVVVIIIPNGGDAISFLERMECSFSEKVFPIFLSNAENLINTKIPENDESLRKTGSEPAHIICVIPEGKEKPNALLKKEVSYIYFDPNSIGFLTKKILPEVIGSLQVIANQVS